MEQRSCATKGASKGLDDPWTHPLSRMECVFSNSAEDVFSSHLWQVGEPEDSSCNSIDFLPFAAGLQMADELSGGKKKDWKITITCFDQGRKKHTFAVNSIAIHINLNESLV